MNEEHWQRHLTLITQTAVKMAFLDDRDSLLALCLPTVLELTGVVGQTAFMALLVWYDFTTQTFIATKPQMRDKIEFSETDISAFCSRLNENEILELMENEQQLVRDISQQWNLPPLLPLTQERIVIAFRTSLRPDIRSPLHLLIVEHDVPNDLDTNDRLALQLLCIMLVANLQRVQRQGDIQRLADVLSSAASILMSAHDISPLITGIRGITENLQTELLEPLSEKNRREFLERLDEVPIELDNLLNDLSGYLEPKVDKPCQVKDIVTTSRLEKAAKIVNKKAEVTLRESASPDTYLRAKPKHLRYALSEIVKNAARAHEKEKIREPIMVSTEIVRYTGRDWVKISVTDQAYGIPKGIQKAMMGGWAPKKREKTGGGLGIGFAFSRTMAHMYRGDILIEKSDKKGTTICIYLPVDVKE